jgi:hypothetical protein
MFKKIKIDKLVLVKECRCSDDGPKRVRDTSKEENERVKDSERT